MKTIVFEGVSKFLLPDDKFVSVEPNRVVIGSPPENYIPDFNDTNCVVYENITAPEDWYGNKYLFDGTAWSVNPAWDDAMDPRNAKT